MGQKLGFKVKNTIFCKTDQFDYAKFIQVKKDNNSTHHEIYRTFVSQLSDGLLLDVGASYGYSAVAFFNLGFKGKIASFEILTDRKPGLKEDKFLFGNKIFKYKIKGVSDAKGLKFLYIPCIRNHPVPSLAFVSSGNEISRQLLLKKIENYNQLWLKESFKESEIQLMRRLVIVMPLDLLLRNRQIKVVGIKIDVEGLEAKVLGGARGIIMEDRPILLVEGANRNATVNSIIETLEYTHVEYDELSQEFLEKCSKSKANDGIIFPRESLRQT